MDYKSLSRDQLIEELKKLSRRSDLSPDEPGQGRPEAESAQELAPFFDELPDGIVLSSPDRKVLLVNRQFCRMFDTMPEPGFFRGRSCAELIGRIQNYLQDAQAYVAETEEILNAGQRRTGIEIRLKDGRVFERDFIPLNSAQGTALFLWHFRDVSEKKQMETALANTVSDLQKERDLFVSGPVVLFKWKNLPGWPVEYVSPNVLDLLGYSDQDFMQGRVNYSELIHPDDLGRVGREVSENTHSGAANFQHQPYRLRTLSGQMLWLSDYTVILRDLQGQALFYVGYFFDSTARVEAEEALSASEERLQLALKGADLGLWDWNIKTGQVSFNQRWAEMLGYRLEELQGRIEDWEKLLHPEDLDRVNQVLLAHLEGKTDFYETEHRLLAKDGGIVWVHDRGRVLLRDEQGNLLRAAGTHLDITERKLNEERLRRSESHLRTLLETIPDLVWLKNPEGVYLSCNSAFATFFGSPPEKIIGKTDFDFLSREEAEFFRKRDQAAVEAGTSLSNEETITYASDGHSEIVETIKTPMYDEQGGLVGVLGIARDITRRRETENLIRNHEQQLHALINSTPDIICFKDGQGRWLEANQADLELFCLTGVDYQGKTGAQLADYTHEMYREAFLTCELTDEKAWQNKTVSRAEEVIPGTDGTSRVYDVIKIPLFNTDDSRKGLVVLGRDITLRKKAETQREKALAALSLSEGRIKALLNAIPDIMFQLDRSGRFLDYNAPHRELYAPPEVFLNKKADEVLPPALAEQTMNYVQKTLSSGEMQVYEYSLLLNNENRYYECRMVVSGKDTVIALIRDITESHQAGEQLKQSEEKYRHLIHHSGDAIYLLYNRRFEIINEKFQELFGLSLNDVNQPSFDFIQLVAPKSKAYIEERLKRAKEGETLSSKYEFTALNKAGKEIEVEASVAYIPFREGQAVQGILRDITERKHLEEQLRQSQKMDAIGQLAGGVAHDFNNMLTVINGYCDLLLMNQFPEKVDESIRQIKRSAEKAANLTSKLLAFSRRQVVQLQTLNLNSVIHDQLKMLDRLLGENIEISTLFHKDKTYVLAEPGQLEQIILNTAINARDAMPEGGRLTIETDLVAFDEEYFRAHVAGTPGWYVMLSLSDTGFGMDETVRARAFEPFFTTKERGRGTGLGLVTVYGIVKQNNGFVYLYSEPGHGTTIKIYLPEAVPDENITPEEPVRDIDLSGSETILLVEDDPGVRMVTQSTLSDYGYEVLTAINGEEALRLYQANQERIDLLLTDVIMPLMGGKELVDRLHQLNPGLKVIFFSGYTDDSIVRSGVLPGGIEFIQKPYFHKDLVRKVRLLLDR